MRICPFRSFLLAMLMAGVVCPAITSLLRAQPWTEKAPDSTELVQVNSGSKSDTLAHYYRGGGSGYWSSAECLSDGDTGQQVCQELSSTAYSNFSGLYTHPRPASEIQRQLTSFLSPEGFREADSTSPEQAAMWRLQHSGTTEDSLTWFEGKPHAQVNVRLDRETAETLRSATAWGGFPDTLRQEAGVWEVLYSARWFYRRRNRTSVKQVAKNRRVEIYQWNHSLAVYDRKRDMHSWFVNLSDVGGASFKVDRWPRIRDVTLSSEQLRVDVARFPPPDGEDLVVRISDLLGATLSSTDATDWDPLARGLEKARFSTGRSTPAGDSTLVVIRADPQVWSPRLFIDTQDGSQGAYTAREWARTYDLAVVANAGMYARDYDTHVGYLRTADGHVNSSNVNHYKSIAAFEPKRSGLPPFRIFDLDETPIDTVKMRYRSVVQNLRLIKRPGENRWPPKEKRWSEMALAEDESGRMLFVFSRSPYSMHVFNEILLDLPLGIVAAQHLEGGPEASLYVNPTGTSASSQMWVGSWETGFTESNDNEEFWPIPNVIGLIRRNSKE